MPIIAENEGKSDYAGVQHERQAHCCRSRSRQAERNADEAAEQGEHNRLDQELHQHLPLFRTDGQMDADFAGARSVTDTNMIFMMPMPPTGRRTAATAGRRPVSRRVVLVIVPTISAMSVVIDLVAGASIGGADGRTSRPTRPEAAGSRSAEAAARTVGLVRALAGPSEGYLADLHEAASTPCGHEVGRQRRLAMCMDCEKKVGRRELLTSGTAGFAALAFGGGLRQARAAEGAPTALSPGKALAALKSGNERYVSHPKLCSVDLATQRSAVAAHQAPWATVISCADSRVPPELIFGGRGVGELFVARNAGNLVDTATLGTVEYGAVVLGSPLIVVLAHTACGAVKAACDVVTKHATYPGAIGSMIEPILPAALAVRKDPGDFVDNAARESARRTAKRLRASSNPLAGLADTAKLKIVAAIYDLRTGVVTYLD